MSFEHEKEQIKKELENLLEELTSISKASKVEYVQNMAPNDTVIPKMFLYTPEAKEKVQQICEESTANIKKILDKIYDSVAAEIVKAPSEEDMNTLTALKMRSTIIESEINIFIDKYLDNVQVYSVLCDIARDNELSIPTPTHPAIVITEELERYWNRIASTFNSFQAEKGSITGVTIAGFIADLDNIIKDSKEDGE